MIIHNIKKLITIYVFLNIHNYIFYTLVQMNHDHNNPKLKKRKEKLFLLHAK